MRNTLDGSGEGELREKELVSTPVARARAAQEPPLLTTTVVLEDGDPKGGRLVSGDERR